MKKKSFFRSKAFFKHLGISVISVALILWILTVMLKLFTHHGRTKTVPDLTGLTEKEAYKVAKNYGLQLIISDSTYVIGRQKGTVVSHIPKMDEKVKKGRRIYATLNAFTKPTVPMPNITGSYRQAKVSLESNGLKVGKLIFVPDQHQNYVVGQQIKGKTVEYGEMVTKGEAIDLILGQGRNRQTAKVMGVIGSTYDEAVDMLINEAINIGKVVYDNTVHTYSDSLNARVFKQHPQNGTVIPVGSQVNLWLTLDDLKIESY